MDESESSSLLSKITAFPRLPFLAGCFFAATSPSGLSSCDDVLDEAAFLVAVRFFSAAVVVLAGCFFVDLIDSPPFNGLFGCKASNPFIQDISNC